MSALVAHKCGRTALVWEIDGRYLLCCDCPVGSNPLQLARDLGFDQADLHPADAELATIIDEWERRAA